MICVIIGRGRHKSLLAEWEEAAKAGAGLVELRVDCLRREPDLKRILAERHTPVVFTARRGVDGGLWRADEERRQRLIREAVVMGVDYVDLEMDAAAKIPRPRFGNTKRIISYHDFKKMPDDLDELGRQMRDLDADIIKVAAIARTVGEASRMLEFVARSNANVPTIGIAMGSVGQFTRILGAKFGAPFTYAGFNPDRTFAPGLLLLRDLQRDFFYDRIDPETEVYAVIGDPIAHSLSPAIHNAAFRELGLNKMMVPFHIPGGTLKESLEALQWLDIKGISVTIPHKEAIIPLLDTIDKSVERIGACNTVVLKDGKRTGHNTDYRAALGSLEDALGGSIDSETSPLLDKQVVVLGSGGVARTLVAGLLRRGAGVTICARNDEKANALAEEFGCRSTTWGMRASNLCDVLINGTPVGMHPNVDATPVPPAAFKPGMLAFDTVYHPENTMFLKLAREHECTTVSGVDMFVRQAALQFKYYTGQDAPEDLMREVVRRKLGALQE
jgi:3-dehydroquinate dehydratase/shikimate dehydrogenase